jgi:cytochrome c oxidase subunit 2
VRWPKAKRNAVEIDQVSEDKMNFPNLRAMSRLASCAAFALVSNLAWAVGDSEGGPAVNQLNVTEGVTPISRGIYALHNGMLLVCLLIFVAVFGVMFYSVIMHRKSRGHQAATFHESTKVEIIWTVLPFLIVIAMAIPATEMVVAMKDTTSADVTVKVTGYQWKWGYDYIAGEGAGIGFLSNLATPHSMIGSPELHEEAHPSGDEYLLDVDNPLVVPVGKKVRLITTAADVIHAWAVQDLGVNQQAIPGFVRDTWFRADKVGTYRGFCVQLCGREHSAMPIVVIVKSQDDYSAWVKTKMQAAVAQADDPNKTWAMPELMARGATVYQQCAVCHQASGKGIPGSFPALDGSAIVNGPKSAQIALVLGGKNAMPSWKQLSDVEIASVITYERNSWGNHTGEAIQPSDVKAVRSAT